MSHKQTSDPKTLNNIMQFKDNTMKEGIDLSLEYKSDKVQFHDKLL